MKKVGILLLSNFITLFSFSQAFTNDYDDIPLGWMKIFKTTEKPKPVTVDHRTYSSEQLSMANEFMYWMQASYHPKGGLGDVKKTGSERLGLYNQNTKSLPQQVGAYSRTYISLKKNAQGKYQPTDGTSWNWRIIANQTIGHEVEIITTEKQYYFYIYHYFDGTKDTEDKDAANMLDFNNHPNLKKYIHFYMPKNGNLGTGLQYMVLLAKDNVLPFIKVTKGEFIQKTAERIPAWYDEEKKKINDDLQRDPKSVPYRLKNLDEMLERAKINFEKLKNKYKDRLNETAVVRPGNNNMSDLTSSITSTSWDFFDNSILQTFPVYKHSADAVEISKTTRPQWVVVSWDAEGVLTASPAGVHLHQSVLNNFNFDYVYDYFFNPGKVKGIAYKPLQSPAYEEKVIPAEASAIAKKMKADRSVLFFEDFSTTPINKIPEGWLSNYNRYALKPVVTKAGNEKENWIDLNGHNFHSLIFNKTLPQNFTASFDVCVRKGFHWGTPGLEFTLTNKVAANEYLHKIIIKIRPGFDERDGWASGHFTSAAKSGNITEKAIPGFSNSKEINRITVSLKRAGTHLQFFAGTVKVYDDANALPADFPLNHFYFTEYNQGWDVENFYVTNIKIIKD